MGISHVRWACFLSFLIVIVIGAKALWEWKRAPFFVLREEAEIRVHRLAPIVVVLLVVNASLLAWRKRGSVPLTEVIPTATPTLTSIPTTPVRSPIPAPTLASTAVPAATARAPTPTVMSPASTPTEGLGASFEVTTLARGLSEGNLPLEPGNVFPEGTKQVYVFFSYTEMEVGMLWTQAWYRGERKVWSQTKPWRLGRQGNAWVYIEFTEGFPPGEYEARLYIDHRFQESVEFTVQRVHSRVGE